LVAFGLKQHPTTGKLWQVPANYSSLPDKEQASMDYMALQTIKDSRSRAYVSLGEANESDLVATSHSLPQTLEKKLSTAYMMGTLDAIKTFSDNRKRPILAHRWRERLSREQQNNVYWRADMASFILSLMQEQLTGLLTIFCRSQDSLLKPYSVNVHTEDLDPTDMLLYVGQPGMKSSDASFLAAAQKIAENQKMPVTLSYELETPNSQSLVSGGSNPNYLVWMHDSSGHTYPIINIQKLLGYPKQVFLDQSIGDPRLSAFLDAPIIHVPNLKRSGRFQLDVWKLLMFVNGNGTGILEPSKTPSIR
jgi:hypothetical protein